MSYTRGRDCKFTLILLAQDTFYEDRLHEHALGIIRFETDKATGTHYVRLVPVPDDGFLEDEYELTLGDGDTITLTNRAESKVRQSVKFFAPHDGAHARLVISDIFDPREGVRVRPMYIQPIIWHRLIEAIRTHHAGELDNLIDEARKAINPNNTD